MNVLNRDIVLFLRLNYYGIGISLSPKCPLLWGTFHRKIHLVCKKCVHFRQVKKGFVINSLRLICYWRKPQLERYLQQRLCWGFIGFKYVCEQGRAIVKNKGYIRWIGNSSVLFRSRKVLIKCSLVEKCI